MGRPLDHLQEEKRMTILYLILPIMFAISISGCDMPVQPRCIDGVLHYKGSAKDVWYTSGLSCKVIREDKQ